MSANIENASGGKELNTMMNSMMKTMHNHSASCGASASFANAQTSRACAAAMNFVNIASIMDAIIGASIIISLLGILILGISQILAVLLSVSVITLLACKTMNVAARP